MLPPNPPFVQKAVRRRIVRRGSGQAPSKPKSEALEAASAELKGFRRFAPRLKPAPKVLKQPH